MANKIRMNGIFEKIKIGMIVSVIILVVGTDLDFISNPIIYSDNDHTINPFLDTCTVNQLPEIRDPFRYYTLCVSDHILGNVRIIPIIGTIALMGVVFLYTRKIINSNIGALISLFILVSTKSFLYYGFTATYDQIWVLLLFTSLILLNTKYRYIAVIPFIVSMGYRGLPLLDLPIMLTQIIILDIPKKQKKIMCSIFIIVALIAIAYTLYGGYAITQYQKIMFNLENGLTGMFILRMDYFFYATLPIECYVLSRIKTKQAGFIIFGITYLFFQIYALNSFTNVGQEPYRLFPLIIFMVMGYGYIFKKYGNGKIR